MPEELLTSPSAAVIQIFASLLFSVIFLFLWRTSRVLHFGFWSLAWAIESQALLCSLNPRLEFLHVLLEVAFAVALAAAAFRKRLLPCAAVFAAYGVFGRWSATHFVLLALIYGYTFYAIGLQGKHIQGIGRRLLRFALAALAVQSIAHGVADFPFTFDLVPQALLVFACMIIWIETQHDTIDQLRGNVRRLEEAASGAAELDHLTGLQNRKALDRYLDEPFAGVVAVCDLDFFKDINDRFGHLVGDEVLRGVGNLIRASIRSEDESFRWGGDEFVIVFRHQHLDLARERMRVLEDRLQTFRIRNHGGHPLGLSWGAAEGEQRPLRTVLEEADLQMYERKRQRHARKV